MQIMGTQFVMGTTIDKALERAQDPEKKGYRYSYDMLGEAARTAADAQRYFDSYRNAIEAIGRAAAGRGPENSTGISIKLSAIHPRYEFSQRQRVMIAFAGAKQAEARLVTARDVRKLRCHILP